MDTNKNLGLADIFSKIDTGNLTQLDQDARDKLDALSKNIYGQTLAEIKDKEKIIDLIFLDLPILVSELSISATSTRRTEVQYCTNGYFAAMKLDLSFIGTAIASRLSVLPKEEVINAYIRMKATLYQLIQIKYQTNEEFLRNLLRTAEVKDDIVAVGRFNKK